MAQYLTLAVLIDGNIQAELQNVTVNGESGAQEVRTILQGLVGPSKGSPMLEVSGTWAIPPGGLEFDFMTACANLTEHEVQIPVGAKSIISRGWFQNFGLSQGTDANSEATATFKGPLTKPE